MSEMKNDIQKSLLSYLYQTLDNPLLHVGINVRTCTTSHILRWAKK